MGYDKEEKYEKFSGIVVELSKNYQEIVFLLKNIEEIEDLKIYISYKKKFFDLLSILFSSVYYNEIEENGNALSLLYEGQKQFSDFQKLSKLQKNESIDKQVKWIDRFIKKYIDKFEQQNKLVYHQKIPNEKPKLISEKTIGKPLEFKFPNASSIWTCEFYDSLNFPKYIKNENSNDEQIDDGIVFEDEEKSKEKKIKKKKETKSETPKRGDNIGGCGFCVIV